HLDPLRGVRFSPSAGIEQGTADFSESNDQRQRRPRDRAFALREGKRLRLRTNSELPSRYLSYFAYPASKICHFYREDMDFLPFLFHSGYHSKGRKWLQVSPSESNYRRTQFPQSTFTMKRFHCQRHARPCFCTTRTRLVNAILPDSM